MLIGGGTRNELLSLRRPVAWNAPGDDLPQDSPSPSCGQEVGGDCVQGALHHVLLHDARPLYVVT